MSSYSDFSGLIVMAHRGGSGEAPENSLVAFQKSVAAGCQYLETDVWLGTDGRLYLHHDRARRDESYPTLDEFCASFPDSFLAIDPKHAAAVEPLAQFIAKHKLSDRVSIGSSFDKRTVRVVELVKKETGQRPSIALNGGVTLLQLLIGGQYLVRRRQKLQADIIYVPRVLVTPRTVRIAHDAGLKMIAWAVNEQAEMKKFISWGVDGFMTDYPSRAQEFLTT